LFLLTCLIFMQAVNEFGKLV